MIWSGQPFTAIKKKTQTKQKKPSPKPLLYNFSFYIQTLSLEVVEEETSQEIHNEVRILSSVLQHLHKVGCFLTVL